MPGTHSPISRRKFLGACCATVGATGLLSTLAQLRLMGATAEMNPAAGKNETKGAGPPGDFKALVCLFLTGGNDANNVVVPTGAADYAAYAAGRGVIALPQNTLLPIQTRTNDGRTWGLHPALPELKALYDQGKCAILGNVGTLSQPLTQAMFNSRPELRPIQLFSHSDQQVQWQTSVPDKPFSDFGTGWGGRIADAVDAMNANRRISMSISLNGQNTFLIGKSVAELAVGTAGAVTLTGAGSGTTVNGIRTAALRAALAQADANLFETAFAGLTNAAIDSSAELAAIVAGASPFAPIFKAIPDTNLAQQLHMVARLIQAQGKLNLKRQIFFVRMGGFDLHDNQVVLGNTVSGAHTQLLRDISQSLGAFYKALGQFEAEDNVTVFTASDFGRTFSTNGDGSDHGWGSHHFILGGAVNGGTLYGQMPNFDPGGPDDVGRGRWLPTTSVDEYAATLAKWFGVSATNMPVILPNIGRFAKPDLGFMRA